MGLPEFMFGVFLITKRLTLSEHYISCAALKWVLVLGLMQLGFLGGLYHLVPQFPPPSSLIFSLPNKRGKSVMFFKFMIWMTAITTVGFIVLSVLDIGFK